jgi:hypothetical protein
MQRTEEAGRVTLFVGRLPRFLLPAQAQLRPPGGGFERLRGSGGGRAGASPQILAVFERILQCLVIHFCEDVTMTRVDLLMPPG